MQKPQINVTPLIDVLLVLLIIFMVVSPTKPSSFKTKIPQEPKNDVIVDPNPDTLVVTIDRESSLGINLDSGFGSVSDPRNWSISYGTYSINEEFRTPPQEVRIHPPSYLSRHHADLITAAWQKSSMR